jgi:hypothetical protein
MIDKEYLMELLAVRGRLSVTLEGGESVRVVSPDDVRALPDGVLESASDLYPPWVEALEERRVIKRKYGEHGPIHINDSGPVRNAIVEFVGNRFVTEEELDAFISKVDESGEKKPHYRKWFKRNGRYFESVTVKGKRLTVLSKLGKRVFEHILERQRASESSLSYSAWALERELNESMAEAERVDEALAFPGQYRIMNCLAHRSLYEKVLKSNGVQVIDAGGDWLTFAASSVQDLRTIANVMAMEKDRNAYLMAWNAPGGESHVNLFDYGHGIDSLDEAVTMAPSSRGDSVRKVIEFAVRNMAKGQTEDRVVSKLAGISVFADLYAAAMELMDPGARGKFEQQFAVKESTSPAERKELIAAARFLLDSFNAASTGKVKFAREFYDKMSAYIGRGWHCDSKAADYVEGAGKRLFTTAECKVVDAAMEATFELFADPYAEGLASMDRVLGKLTGRK